MTSFIDEIFGPVSKPREGDLLQKLAAPFSLGAEKEQGGDFGRTGGEMARDFFTALGGGEVRRPNAEAQKQVFDFLKARGASDEDARAAVASPAILQGVLSQVMPKRPAPSQAPSEVRLYQFDMAQRKASGQEIVPFGEWRLQSKRAGATSINVGDRGINYGKPEKGLVWARDQEGNIQLDERGAPVAIPYRGGPAFIEQGEQERAAETRLAEDGAKGDMLTQTLDLIEGSLTADGAEGFFASGAPNAVARDIPGTPAFDNARRIETVKANLGFDKLQAMRDASPTGGALGQVSERELTFLQATMGSLETAQSKQEILRVVGQVRDHIKGRSARLRAAYEKDAKAFGPEAAQRALQAGGFTIRDLGEGAQPGGDGGAPRGGGLRAKYGLE